MGDTLQVLARSFADERAESVGRFAEQRAELARAVFTCAMGSMPPTIGHEACTRAEIARRLARLLGCGYGGEHDPTARYDGRPYFVPSDTLSISVATSLGIRSVEDLFGGVVPESFVATKTITHPLIAPDAAAPRGWSAQFPRLVASSVLAGYTAFAKPDALRAGRLLLERGPVRVKLASGIAGMGQSIADDEAGLTQVLDTLTDADIAAGFVIEENLV